jgi:hypothetical protein
MTLNGYQKVMGPKATHWGGVLWPNQSVIIEGLFYSSNNPIVFVSAASGGVFFEIYNKGENEMLAIKRDEIKKNIFETINTFYDADSKKNISVLIYQFNLDFDDNYAEVLKEMLLEGDIKLVTVKLDGTDMTDIGIQSIADALKKNNDVTTLSLQFSNKMSDKGLMAIAEVLPNNVTLERVYLEKPNKVTTTGAQYLAEKVSERIQMYPSLPLDVAFQEGLEKGVAEAYSEKLEELNSHAVSMKLSPY